MTTRAVFLKSPVTDIASLRFYPLPARPTKVVRAMRVGNHHILIGDGGRIYTSQVNGMRHWATTSRLNPTIQALIAFGMLSEQAVQQHKDAEREEREADQRRWAAESILDAVDAASLLLTPDQLAQLYEAAPDRKP